MDAHSPQLAPPSKTKGLIDVWNVLEIRVLVMSSLGIQILLLCLAGFRKHFISSRWAKNTDYSWKGPLYLMFHWVLWSAYLLADYVATVALAYLPNSELNNDKEKENQHLLMFWAPFFLLHLGGQDTITALSVEDNELWARHLLTLLTQVGLALYHYISVNRKVGAFWPPAAIMFVLALFKYGERIWALQRASMSALRSSMITKPDPGPNYAKFMQQYTSSIAAGLTAQIIVEVEKHEDDLKRQKIKESAQSKPADSEKINTGEVKNHPRSEQTKESAQTKPADSEEINKGEVKNQPESEQTKESAQSKAADSEEINTREVKNHRESKQTKESAKSTGEVKNQGDPESPQTKRSKCCIFCWSKCSCKCEPISELEREKYAEIVCKAYKFFPTFKRLFVDLILTYKDREESQEYFEGLEYEGAYKLIEIELSWMYEILHSKASVIFSYKHYGWISRMSTLVITIVALILFITISHPQKKISDHSKYNPFDIILTYVLIGGACVLEVAACIFMLLSFWTYAAIKESGGCFVGLADFLFRIQARYLRRPEKSRWSDKMAQFSLITYSLPNQPSCSKCNPVKCILYAIRMNESWDQYRYASSVTVSEALKKQVFQELTKKVKSIEDRASYKRITEHRGQWALQRMGYYQEFGWSVEAEFDESILLWHIATDLLYHGKETCETEDRSISQDISNYMLFLLIVRPFMMPAGIGQIRFGDTCAEARIFLDNGDNIEIGDAAKKILDVSTDYDPGNVKGDRSKSVLFKGCLLAHQLEKQVTKYGVQWDRMWRLIRAVWVEMLCYAASKCSGQYHAKQLSKGGELLTVIWFLMAHLGMGEQYRIEEGHARAKLFVEK
ncbi:hypothetical protein LUZ62_025821 [Rhynchospora pubera]|uniref:DUF4220 domain-containing protein n=1 Tax=Rhynchospora pubera TaxID=906938 RepID=A0AAV8HBG6_9POAL|nr:hypothetical protein LUZ62_025821 [Rhynchospora pubera]